MTNLRKAMEEFLDANEAWFTDANNAFYGKEGEFQYVFMKLEEYVRWRQSWRGRWFRFKRWLKPSTNG